MSDRWIIYGANGFTGRLIAEEAVQRGHKPVLGGRSAQKLAPVAERLGLEYHAFDLNNRTELHKEISAFDLVLHAAGPFVHTSPAMVRACLDGHTHYLDITGEVPVFAQVLSLDTQARRSGIALIPGVGFDVVPSDCLANYVAQRVSNPTTLEIALTSGGRTSGGTAQTAVEMAPTGFLARRNGRLVNLPPGKGTQRVRFLHNERWVVPFTWGDLVTAYHSTGIPNITTYMAVNRTAIFLLRWYGPGLLRTLRLRPVRYLARWFAKRFARGTDAETRQKGRAYLWARAENGQGERWQAWLDVPEGYRFTALASVRSVEKVLGSGLKGAFTPAQAFGEDFVLEIDGSRRLDDVRELESVERP